MTSSVTSKQIKPDLTDCAATIADNVRHPNSAPPIHTLTDRTHKFDFPTPHIRGGWQEYWHASLPASRSERLIVFRPLQTQDWV